MRVETPVMSAFFINTRRRGQQKAEEKGSLKMGKRRKIEKFRN
jgi:hypothetical protein